MWRPCCPRIVKRMLFFEEAKKQAELDVKKDPKNAQAFTRWGGALLELAHFRSGNEAYEMIEMVGFPTPPPLLPGRKKPCESSPHQGPAAFTAALQLSVSLSPSTYLPMYLSIFACI